MPFDPHQTPTVCLPALPRPLQEPIVRPLRPARATLATLVVLVVVGLPLAHGDRPDLAARPADEPWSTNRQLTLNPNGAPHAMPAVAAGGTNGYAAWFDCSTFIRQAPGCLPFIGFGAWTGAGPLALQASASDNFVARKAYPSIGVDGRGATYVIWLDGRDFSGQFQNADKADVYFSSAPAGGTFSENVRLNAPEGSAQWQDRPDLQVDGAGNAAAVWVGGGAGVSDVFFSYRPTGGSWSAAVPVDENAPSGPRLQPRLAMDEAGNDHVVWVENGSLRYAHRPFGGRWTASARLDDGNWLISDPDIAVDPAGGAHAVWTGARSAPANAALFYTERPAGGAWQPPVWLDFDAAGYGPRRSGSSIDTNDAGDVYLAWLQHDPVGGLFLPAGVVRFGFRPAGKAWGASERVTDRCCPALDYVSLAVDDEGGAHVAWTDERNMHADPEGYRQDIFSASRDRPETAPVEKLTIRGRVYGAPDASETYPVIGAPVSLMRGQRVLRRTLSLPPDGAYVLDDVPKQDGLVISTTLSYAAVQPTTFRITYGRTSPPLPVHLRTFPMQLAEAEGDVTRNLAFTAPSNFDIDARIQPDDLGSLAVAYFHTRQAALLAEALGQTLDLNLPVDVVMYSRDAGVFWHGPITLSADSAGRDAYINVESRSAASYYMDSDRPTNREWHEFGHHVMADALGNRLPWAPNTANHSGYKNPSSTDSWVEGFAEFYAMLVNQEIARSPRPQLYVVSGVPLNMEDNYLAWTNEEFAVASLLWDVHDAADDLDATRFPSGSYRDGVAVDLRSLWELLTRDWGQGIGRPSHAPAGYGHILDVKHLFDVLTAADVGSQIPPGESLTQLEALFVAHGLFDDANGNKAYDAGEVIGRTGGTAQRGRRKAPAQAGSFIAADAVDAATGAPVPIQDFTISRCYAPPLAERNHAWRQRLDSATGRLHFYGPDPQVDATAYIVAHAPGYRPSAPLQVSNADYWARMAAEPADDFLQHTFRLERGSVAYLPAARNGSSPGPVPDVAAADDASVAAVGLRAASNAQADPPAVRCGGGAPPPPPTPGPSPTRRPTATRTATVPIPPTDTAAATATSTATAPVAPTPTATSTMPATPPTSTPSVAGTAQRVAGALTTDPANRARTAFVAGDTVWLWGLVVNDEALAVERDVAFRVTSESGFVADGLSWQGTLSLPPGANWFRFERTVGNDVPPALYELAVKVTAGGESTSRASSLYIASSLGRADDFSDAGSGWPVGASDSSAYGYAGGEYRIAIDSADKTRWTSGGTRGDDLIVEGDVRVDGGVGAAALVLGLNDAGTDFTIFGIHSAGRYGLFRSTDSTWRTLVPWTDSPAVPPVGTSGHLMLARRGDRLRLFVGGAEVGAPPAERIPAGRLGWYAEASVPVLEARFDNFRVYAP